MKATYRKVWGTRFWAVKFPECVSAAVVDDFGSLVCITVEAQA